MGVDVGGLPVREPRGTARAAGGCVCAAGGKVQSLEPSETAFGAANRIRCAGKLEIDLRELFGVLSLSISAPGALETDSLRFSRERSLRGSVPGGLHADYQRQQFDHQRQRLRAAGGR